MFRVLQLMRRLLPNSWKLLKFLPPMAKLALLEAAVKTTDSRIGGDGPNISKTSSFTISMETVPKMNRWLLHSKRTLNSGPVEVTLCMKVSWLRLQSALTQVNRDVLHLSQEARSLHSASERTTKNSSHWDTKTLRSMTVASPVDEKCKAIESLI